MTEVVGTSYSMKGDKGKGAAEVAEEVNAEEEKAQIPLHRVFRYATHSDKALIAIGCICGIIHGTMYVVSNIVLGLQVDTFMDFEKGNQYLMDFDHIWDKYNVTRFDLWDNKSMIDIIAQRENLTDRLNSSFLSPNIENVEFFFDQMKLFTNWYLIMGGVTLIVAYGQITCWVIPAERQTRVIRIKFLQCVLRQEVGWYDIRGVGELNTRLSDDIHKILDGIGDKFGTFVQMLTAFVAAFIQGFAIGWKLSCVMLVIVPVLTGAAMVASVLNTALTSQELKAYARAGKIAEEVLGAIRTVASFGGEEKECERYNDNLWEARRRGIRKGMILGLGMGAAWIVLYGSYSLGFWYGAKLVREEPWNYTPGRLLVVFFSILTGAVAIGQAGPKIQAISVARGAAYAIFNIIDRVPVIDSAMTTGIKPKTIIGNMEFRDVWFKYPSRPDVPVLNGLNLTVGVGQTVALVGSSGCGKSTTVQLIQRFYDALKGQVLIDGIDIRDYNLPHLRQFLGIVSQEPVLFGTSIAENISYGRENVTMAEIEEAAKQANAYNFIDKLPKRFDTLVGDRGAQLSGGQKQRIAIARALVRNPKILLLDEATSALDTESESIVQSALDRASKGRTTIVIAHRLSTVRRASKICGFKDGVVIEQGPHEELMKQVGGIYHSLVTLQSRQAAMDAKAAAVDGGIDDLEEKKHDPDDVEIFNVPAEDMMMEEEEPIGMRRLSDGLRRSWRHSMQRTASGIGFGASVAAKNIQHSQEEELKQLEKFSVDPNAPIPEASINRISRLNAPEWGFILGGSLASLINGGENPVFAIVFTYLLGVFLEPTPERQEEMASRYCLIFLGIGVGLALAQFCMNYLFAQSGERLTMRLRRMAFKAMMRQDISWYDDHTNNLGALCTRLATESSAIQGATGSRIGLILQNISNIGVGLILAFVFGPKLSGVLFAFIPLIAVTGVVETKLLSGASISDKKQMEKAGKVALEAIENIRTVAGLTKEKKFCEMYAERLELPYKSAVKKAHIFGACFALSQTILYIAFAIAFLYGAHLIRTGEMDFNRVFMVVTVIIFGAMGIGETIAFAPDFTKAKFAAAKMFALFDRIPPIDVASTAGSVIPDFTGTVDFRNVRFRYPTRPTAAILRGVSLGVSPGKTVALVGSSGCGKSTSVALVERFYDALAGEVTFDGVNLKDLNLQWVRRQVGLVGQEPVLFDASIAENIAYGDNFREIPMDEIVSAAKSANIHNFISTLPLAYDTRVGDKGTQLSGGQKQRVAIARALIRMPKVLLLDEATSALDTESEKIVQEALDNARTGRTCIVIAHRLSTIQDADQICVFHNGKIVERGKHAELLNIQGIYWNLQQVQKGNK